MRSLGTIAHGMTGLGELFDVSRIKQLKRTEAQV